MIFSIKPQIFELKCVFSYFRLKTYITLLLPVYVHSWEQRKFGEIASKYEDPVPTPHDGYYRLGIRSHAKGTFHSYVAKGQELETAQMHRVAAGNFIVNITFGWEHAVAITDENDAGKLVSHRFPQFSFAEGMVPEFFRYVIVDEKFRHYLWLASPGGAGRNRVLKLDDMLNYLMRFPSRDEQIKIAEFFRQLDHLITLHQCKCQIDGCRFQSPLAITWEQRKVTEIGKIYIGLVTTMTKHYTDEGTLLIRNSDIKDGKFEFGDNPIYLEKTFAEKNETRMHQIGDVITVHTGDVGTSAVITENEAKSIGFATIVTRPNPKIIDSNYLCSFLNTDKHKKWAVSISTGDGRTNYNLGDYFELVVPVPSIAEQKKIASYIQKLNRLITLHQCE